MEHIHFRIIKIKQETSEAKSYFLEEINQKKVDYKAGQFLTLLVNVNNKDVRRSYSLCAAPGVDDHMFFTIKRVENGELSRHLLTHLREGDILTSLPPTGRFVIEYIERDLLVFIAAGSGITPVFSLVKHVLHSFTKGKVLLVYQNRTEDEAIFRQDFQQLQRLHPERFVFREIFSQPTSNDYMSQRLNNNLLENILLKEIKEKSVGFYLCGPEAFMRMAQFTLKVMGFDQELIKKENFYATAPPPPLMTDTTPRNVTIHYNNNTYQVQVAYPQSILDAALKNNISLPFSCRGGRCSTCTSRCTSGHIKMSINDVLTPKDLADGLILTCVAYAESDVELTFETLEEEQTLF